jgi:hypothetical protein
MRIETIDFSELPPSGAGLEGIATEPAVLTLEGLAAYTGTQWNNYQAQVPVMEEDKQGDNPVIDTRGGHKGTEGIGGGIIY